MSSSKSSQPKERDSLVGPILMVGAGIIFLFNNLGWVEWSIWESLLRLWPLLLIIGGLDLIIGRRSAVGGVVVAILAVALLVGGIWVMNSDVASSPTVMVSGENVAFPIDGAQKAVVKISLSTGELRLGDGAAAANVLDGKIQNPKGERIKEGNVREGDTLYTTLTVRESTSSILPSSSRNNLWDLHLNQEMPMTLAVSTGVGESTLDLRRLTLTGLDLNIGIGTTTVSLPRQGDFSGEISGGIGRTVIRVPADLAVRLDISTGIGGKSVPASFRKEGDTYASPAYVTAGGGVELDVSGGIGAIQVELIPAE